MDTYESSPNDGKFGFMNRIKRGFRITKLGIHVVKADPELMVYLYFLELCHF